MVNVEAVSLPETDPVHGYGRDLNCGALARRGLRRPEYCGKTARSCEIAGGAEWLIKLSSLLILSIFAAMASFSKSRNCSFRLSSRRCSRFNAANLPSISTWEAVLSRHASMFAQVLSGRVAEARAPISRIVQLVSSAVGRGPVLNEIAGRKFP
jgi:hypothetical protein